MSFDLVGMGRLAASKPNRARVQPRLHDSLTGDVIHNHGHSGVSDVGWDEGAEALLSCSVPQLQPHLQTHTHSLPHTLTPQQGYTSNLQLTSTQPSMHMHRWLETYSSVFEVHGLREEVNTDGGL